MMMIIILVVIIVMMMINFQAFQLIVLARYPLGVPKPCL